MIADAPAFDQRPGTLEATRGLPPLSVIGARDERGWSVALVGGGGGLLGSMTAAEARALAAQLIAYADLAERGSRA